MWFVAMVFWQLIGKVIIFVLPGKCSRWLPCIVQDGCMDNKCTTA